MRSAGDGSVSSGASLGYDDYGNLTSIDGPLAGAEDTLWMRYDAVGRLVGRIAPDPDGGGPRRRRAERIGYDADDRVTSREVGSVAGTSDGDWDGFAQGQQVASRYDARGFKERDTVYAGGATYGVTDYGYDGKGRLRCTAVRMNPAAWGQAGDACALQGQGSDGPDRIALTEYDALDRVVATTSGYGTADAAQDARVSYAENGKIESATDANGNVTRYGYDGFGRRDRTFYPSPGARGQVNPDDWEGFAYDAGGRLTEQRLRDGQVYLPGYDALGRVTGVRRYRPGAGIFDTTSYGYDLAGRLTVASQGSTGRTTRRSYDALGRQLTDGQTWGTMSSAYDAAGRRVRLAWPDGSFVTYEYDPAGQMIAIRDGGAGVLARYAYDDIGGRTSVERGNGTATRYRYDAMERLVELVQDIGGTSYDDTRTFTYNPAGQIASRTGSNDAYAYGGLANVDRPYAANGLNQYASAGPATFVHDARGNLTRSTTPQADVTYAYDMDNQLTSMTSGSTAFGFRYDPLGRMEGDEDNYYHVRLLYDGGMMVGRQNASRTDPNAAQGGMSRFVPGPWPDEAVVWYYPGYSRAPLYFHADERGSVVALSNADGSGNGINRYDEFGVYDTAEGYGLYGPFGFTGQYWVRMLGMSYYKARMYSPTLGRFMQTDPIGYADGMNWYNYVGSDPVNRTDPSGLMEAAITVDGPNCHGAAYLFEGGSFAGCAVGGGGGYAGTGAGFAGETRCTPTGRGGSLVCPPEPPPTGEAASEMPQNVTVDKSCANVPAAKDPFIQQQMLSALGTAGAQGAEQTFVVGSRDGHGPFSYSPLRSSGIPRVVRQSDLDASVCTALYNGYTLQLLVHTHQNNPPPSPIGGGNYNSADYARARHDGFPNAAIDRAGTVTCTTGR